MLRPVSCVNYAPSINSPIAHSLYVHANSGRTRVKDNHRVRYDFWVYELRIELRYRRPRY